MIVFFLFEPEDKKQKKDVEPLPVFIEIPKPETPKKEDEMEEERVVIIQL